MGRGTGMGMGKGKGKGKGKGRDGGKAVGPRQVWNVPPPPTAALRALQQKASAPSTPTGIMPAAGGQNQLTAWVDPQEAIGKKSFLGNLLCGRGGPKQDQVIAVQPEWFQASKQYPRAVLEACRSGDIGAIVKYLRSGGQLDDVDSDGAPLLSNAALKGKKDIVDYLLHVGANPNQSDNDGATPLHYATEEGHAEVVEALLTAGAKTERSTAIGGTALHVAAENGHVDVVRALCEGGANPSAADKYGWTSLHLAADIDDPAVVKELLRYGANPDMKNHEKASPLHFAARKNGPHSMEIVQMLVAAGARP